MRTFAYDEEYVTLAQRVMGDMLDYAVNTLNGCFLLVALQDSLRLVIRLMWQAGTAVK